MFVLVKLVSLLVFESRSEKQLPLAELVVGEEVKDSVGIVRPPIDLLESQPRVKPVSLVLTVQRSYDHTLKREYIYVSKSKISSQGKLTDLPRSLA